MLGLLLFDIRNAHVRFLSVSCFALVSGAVCVLYLGFLTYDYLRVLFLVGWRLAGSYARIGVEIIAVVLRISRNTEISRVRNDSAGRYRGMCICPDVFFCIYVGGSFSFGWAQW